jgi:hypothetical protein
MSNNPVRLQSGDGIPITQTDNALDVNIASGLDSVDPATQTTLAAVLAKIIAAPSTEAKQDLILAALGLIATEATAGDIKTAVETLAVATPDTVSGDLASMSADLGAIRADIALMRADLAAILAILGS